MAAARAATIGLARGHGFQKHDSEALLHAGQAEQIRAIVFRGKLLARDVAHEADRVPKIQIAMQCVQPGSFRAVAHQPHRQARNAAAQLCGGFEQQVQALTRVEPAHR